MRGLAHALRDPAARQKAIKEYGIAWLIDAKDKQLWPASALHDDDFFIQYLELKKSGMASLPSATATADLLASANHHVSIGKAAPESVPAVPAPSTAGTPFSFAAALAGRHVKVELPKPRKFSRIAVDSDIRAWLLRMPGKFVVDLVRKLQNTLSCSDSLAAKLVASGVTATHETETFRNQQHAL